MGRGPSQGDESVGDQGDEATIDRYFRNATGLCQLDLKDRNLQI